MLNKDIIRNKALELGFHAIGFTGVEDFVSQADILKDRSEYYEWAEKKGMHLMAGTRPAQLMEGARTIIVLLENYYTREFPSSLTGIFGRCYLDDDRVTKDGLALKIKAFRAFLRDMGISSAVPAYVPHRQAAARAGLGTFGKNCMFYARDAALGSSWVIPIAILVDAEIERDQPTVEFSCPDWCRNACIAACPTGALRSPGKIDPRRCISYLSYYGEDLTPVELREPMGMWVYGCDRCQNVCPRNEAWLVQELPMNEGVAARAGDFNLKALLHMDIDYFSERIKPHMFYMSKKDIWRWKMNVARAMGNSRNQDYVPELIKAFRDNDDARVRSMVAWSLGRLGGNQAVQALEEFAAFSDGQILSELIQALVFTQKNPACK